MDIVDQQEIRLAITLAELDQVIVLNRVDEIVVFHSLSEADLKKILDVQLGRLRARLEERHIDLELTAVAATHLAREGYDPVYGARPLKRAIQRLLENRLALRLLEGDFAEGDTVLVDAQDGDLSFTSAATLSAVQA